jgi:hypothetical protein
MPGPEFSVQEIPFSHEGSWFDFSPVIAENTYADDVHLVSHQTGLHPVLKLVPHTGGVRVATTVVAVPSKLAWCRGDDRIELAYESADTVRVRGAGLGLCVEAATRSLTPFSGAYFLHDPVDGAYLFTLYETGRRYRLTVLSGPPATAVGSGQLGTTERTVVLGDDEPWEVAIEEYDSARPPYRPTRSFADVVATAATAFDRYADAIAPWRTASPACRTAELAAYVLWSATVRPAGFLTRPAVLMSKHWMDKVWSWDHCFNALALAEGLPALALGQFRLPFDHQDDAGALPDSVAHSEILYNFVKPPVHGWALRRLRHRVPIDRAELADIYRRLAGWTEFWLTARRVPGHPLAHYQHGNDSGWDNATTFDPTRTVESADLAAFLVLQLRELADLATELGHAADTERWTAAADDMRAALLELWTGQGFAARAAGTRRTWTSTSLLNLMPIVLAGELPGEVREALAHRIRQHLTPHGLATELPTSPHYEDDGYWRGPIWAPATILIEDGLRRSGFTDLADDISSRFRALCERSGFAENFDALTGAGLRDRAYTWTASAYLILATACEQRRAQGST